MTIPATRTSGRPEGKPGVPGVREAGAGAIASTLLLLEYAYGTLPYWMMFALAILALAGAHMAIGFTRLPADPIRKSAREMRENRAEALLAKARQAVNQIDEANAEIPDREITAAMTELCEIAGALLDRVGEDAARLASAATTIGVFLDGAREATAEFLKIHRRDSGDVDEATERRFLEAILAVVDRLRADVETLDQSADLKLGVKLDVLRTKAKSTY